MIVASTASSSVEAALPDFAVEVVEAVEVAESAALPDLAALLVFVSDDFPQPTREAAITAASISDKNFFDFLI